MKVLDWEEVPVVFGVDFASDLLQIKERTLRKMARCNEIPAKKINSEWRFSKEEIYSWLKGK